MLTNITFLCALLAGIHTAQTPTFMHIHINDDQGRSLKDGFLIVRSRAGEMGVPIDSHGETVITLPSHERSEYIRIMACSPGRCPAFVQWPIAGPHVEPIDAPPAEFTFALKPGATIGGIVKNESGDAVPGVEVGLFFESVDSTQGQPAIRAPYNWLSDFPVLTDENGRWTSDMAPLDWGSQGFVQPRHPDYFQTGYLLPIRNRGALLAGKEESTLVRGRRIRGTVFGPNGEAVAGARLVCGPSCGEQDASTHSAADGSYSIEHVSPEYARLLVMPPDRTIPLAPMIIPVAPGEPVRIDPKLTFAKIIHGRLVDEAGAPIAAAHVDLGDWGKGNAIDRREFTRIADDAGRFTMAVPDREVNFRVSAFGFAQYDDAKLQPIEREQSIVLKRNARVSGSVTDARTGKPIATFRAVGATIAPGLPLQFLASDCAGHDGNYDLTFGQTADGGYEIRINADGYLPSRSAILFPTKLTGAMRFDAALVSAESIRGKVLRSDGKPVSGARVMVVTAESGPFDLDQTGVDTNGVDAAQVLTDASGNFEAPPPGLPYTLFVTHENCGWACVPPDMGRADSTIRLQPWGTVIGRLGRADEPVRDAHVFARSEFRRDDTLPINFSTQLQSDALGRFEIRHLPAGRVGVVWQLEDAETGKTLVVKPIDVRAGETVQATFDTNDAPAVCGRFVLPEGLPENVVFQQPTLTQLDGSNESLRDAYDARAMFLPSTLTYRLSPSADRAFRIPHVEPGRYRLSARATTLSPGGYCGEGETVALIEREVIIKPSDAPLDLGDLKLAIAARIAVGDTAPPFDCITLDGRPLSTESFRGKYVVLDFWATWCGPCKAELPFLKAAHDTFANDPRIAFVSLSLDSNIERAKTFSRETGMAWTQGYVGEWNRSTVRDAFKVGAIPSIWLIDAQGRVVAKNLRGEGIRQQLEKHLAAR